MDDFLDAIASALATAPVAIYALVTGDNVSGSPIDSGSGGTNNDPYGINQGLTNLGQSIDDSLPTGTELLVGVVAVIVVLVLILLILGKVDAL